MRVNGPALSKQYCANAHNGGEAAQTHRLADCRLAAMSEHSWRHPVIAVTSYRAVRTSGSRAGFGVYSVLTSGGSVRANGSIVSEQIARLSCQKKNGLPACGVCNTSPRHLDRCCGPRTRRRSRVFSSANVVANPRRRSRFFFSTLRAPRE